MKIFSIKVFLFISIFLITSNSAQSFAKLHVKRVVLSWENYDLKTNNLEEVSYYLDNILIGKGKAGFNKVLVKLSQLPDGSVVVINSSITAVSTTAEPPKVYPFQHNKEMENKFHKIIKDKNMKIEQ